MTVREMIAKLTELPADASVIVVNDDSGVPFPIDRVCGSEDPPEDGSDEVWVVIGDE